MLILDLSSWLLISSDKRRSYSQQSVIGNQASYNFKALKELAISRDETDQDCLSISQKNGAYASKNSEICKKTAFFSFVLP